MRLWSTARPAAEIDANKKKKLPVGTSRLLGLWDFEAGSGQTITDRNGNSNHGVRGTGGGSDSADPSWSTDTPY